MSEPKVADSKPVVVDLDRGTYWWCSCGRSLSQPYCDGSHAGSGFQPVRLEVQEACRSALCMCKHTGDKPFCDGSHSRLGGA